MANSRSAKKRIRQASKRRLENWYYGKTTRNAIRELQAITSKEEAEAQLPIVV
ncbi:MAG TPA: 30S ribosomal protein S20, partial [Chitinophagales bacterium]|nr:30S ribosomal protein S20 [Chitinophagales bacterium]